jgi:hypothetical protein
VKNRIKMLKVKIKSLAAEAKIIRLEERKALKAKDYTLYARLREHRTANVRQEARHSQLAYTCIKNTQPYERIERTCRSKPQWGEVTSMVNRFGSPVQDWDHGETTEEYAYRSEWELTNQRNWLLAGMAHLGEVETA